MIYKLLVLLSVAGIINCVYYNETPYLSFIKSDVHFLNYYNPWFNQTIDYLETLSNSNQVRPQCRSSMKRWIDGIENREAWALKFLESTGKTLNGKLVGRNVNYGSFEYCTLFFEDHSKKIDFDGKYCLVSLHTKESQAIRNEDHYRKYYAMLSERSRRLTDFSVGNAHGVCIPSTCDINELASVTNDILKPYGFQMMTPKRCSTRSEPEPVTNLQIVSFAIIFCFIALCLLSLFIKNEFLNCFSLVDNYNIIYNFDQNEEAEKSAFMHGGKTLMLVASIMTHSIFFGGLYFSPSYDTVKEVEGAIKDNLQIFLERFLPFAGQMFLIGGFFAMYAWYDVIKEKKFAFTYFTYFFVRYMRMAVIAVPILLLYFILPHLGSGPLYSDITNHLYENCKANGYKFFTAATNLNDRVSDMCNVGNWYLSADFQIYIFNFFAIYYLVVKPKLGLAIAAVQMVLASLMTIGYVKMFNLPPFANTWSFEIFNVTEIQDQYFPFFYHYNNYMIGVLCAYFVKSKTKPKFIDYKIVRAVISITLSTTAYYFVFWYPHHIEQTNQKLNRYLEILFPVLDKIIMSLLHAWIYYTCAFGYSSGIRKIASLRMWIPLSRLAFPISLSQFIWITFSFALSRNSYSMNKESIQMEIFNNVVFTFLLSNFIFLFIEGPLINLTKKYLGLKKRHEPISAKKNFKAE